MYKLLVANSYHSLVPVALSWRFDESKLFAQFNDVSVQNLLVVHVH
jgi:hypothetical protein